YQTAHAENGAAAEEMLEQVRPDLVIMDLMLPDADGLVLTATLKAKMDVPIIICSGTARKRDAVLGFKLGADDFIPKPFEPAELEARVEAVLRRAAQTRAESDSAADAAAETASAAGLAARGGGPEHIHLGHLEIDNSRRSVTLGGRPIQV